jgi:hypothetical protein
MSGRLKILIVLMVLISGLRLTLALWDWLEQTSITPKQVRAYFEAKDRPYLEISPEARIRLLQKIKTVKIGDTVEEVYEKMGKPPANLPPTTRPLEHEAGVPSNMVVGSQMIAYYIRQKKLDQFSEDFDEHIYLFLDEDDTVKYIYILRQDEAKPVHYPDPMKAARSDKN